MSVVAIVKVVDGFLFALPCVRVFPVMESFLCVVHGVYVYMLVGGAGGVARGGDVLEIEKGVLLGCDGEWSGLRFPEDCHAP